jgi:hypothetical protein
LFAALLTPNLPLRRITAVTSGSPFGFGSLAILVSTNFIVNPDFRPVTLRRQLLLVLRFGSRSLNDYLTASQFDNFRAVALCRQLSLVLLFSAAWQS